MRQPRPRSVTTGLKDRWYRTVDPPEPVDSDGNLSIATPYLLDTKGTRWARTPSSQTSRFGQTMYPYSVTIGHLKLVWDGLPPRLQQSIYLHNMFHNRSICDLFCLFESSNVFFGSAAKKSKLTPNPYLKPLQRCTMQVNRHWRASQAVAYTL